jgi:hypothetical protein
MIKLRIAKRKDGDEDKDILEIRKTADQFSRHFRRFKALFVQKIKIHPRGFGE